ncbi:baseplate assembly protein [Brevundimonas sp. UBA7664]|uniref:baseplate assembly protein n=1 Tax=Brevundimonas sp. UBA7664 TaxID=1946141 RepID=UPI0025C44693|nr:baseplate J/gp47 family protein [Brevundimonas sp. UBA7664]
MLSPSVTNTGVDLSKLPSPEVVETLSYDVILAAMLADLVARDPAFTALVPSDPAMRILEVCAYRELLIRQRVNDACRGVMVAYAVGGALDHLGSLVGAIRLVLTPADEEAGTDAVLESDDSFRRRIVLAPDGFSVAGPEAAYVYHALSAHPDVLDATAISPEPGEVLVTIQSRIGSGVADAEVLEAVDAALNAETVRPLTDQVTVQSASIVNYAAEAELWIFAGPDSAVVLAEAIARRDLYIAECRRLGRTPTRSGLIAAQHVAGVQRVVQIQPAADVEVDRTQVAVCTSASTTIAGIDE